MLNTRRSADYPEEYPERLDTLAAARAWAAADLADEPFAAGVTTLDTDGLAAARTLRDAIVTAIDHRSGEPERTAAWAAIDEAAGRTPLELHLGPNGSALRPAPPVTLAALLLTALSRVLDEGRWSRIRLCARDTCRGAFYDTTRNRTQCWHSYASCGNRSNQAAYRCRAG
ncbi:CGNR zinc finger domain-containing protein [Microbacteriaceae bacterium VKM Ac-2854]|nr:CGNR zinc finger domain-containing protein [Microbacteriaceae bacterium VKM Ac-2854]